MGVSIIAVYYYSRKLIAVSDERNRLFTTVSNVKHDLFERNNQVNVLNKNIKELFSQRFELINSLAYSYYECRDSGHEQKKIYNKVVDEIAFFSSDRTLKELEVTIDKCKDNLFTEFRRDFPTLPKSQYQLALYLFSGFSTHVISIFTGKELQNIHVYKSRLKALISKKDSSISAKYLIYF